MSRAKEQISFAKKMSFLIKAGIPILESLLILKEQTNSKRHIEVLKSLINDISNGQNLSKSLAKFPKLFSAFSINVIRVGETNGTLSKNFHYLAEELKKGLILKHKTLSALFYPAIIATATLVLTGLLTVYIFPKVMPIFSSLNVSLPFSTRMMLFTSDFLIHYGLWMITAFTVTIFVFYFSLKKYKRFHAIFDLWILSTPLIGKLFQFYNLAAQSRTIGLLLKSGARLSEIIPLTAETTPNRIYKHQLHSLSLAINRGEKISIFLKNHKKLFPDIFVQMVAVGESSGNLSETFLYLAEFYDHEIEEYTKNFSNLLEPMLMIALGLIVSFMAIAVITPIYGITEHLHPR